MICFSDKLNPTAHQTVATAVEGASQPHLAARRQDICQLIEREFVEASLVQGLSLQFESPDEFLLRHDIAPRRWTEKTAERLKQQKHDKYQTRVV